MTWLERKVTNWLVGRIFKEESAVLDKLDYLNSRILQNYKKTFYEDNRFEMAYILRTNLENALKQDALEQNTFTKID